MSSLIERTLRGVQRDLKVARRIQLSSIPWWGWLAIILSVFIIGFSSYSTPYWPVTRILIFAVFALSFTIVLKWPLRRCSWFWTTLTVLIVLHVPLIAIVSRATEHFTGPSIVIGGLGILDLYIMLTVLNLVEQFLKKPTHR